MGILIAFLLIVSLLAFLDFAAIKWGKSIRRNGWASGSYDVRDEWHTHC